MSKRIVVISTSPRRGGNSDALAAEFARGAREAGYQVEEISLRGRDIGFCCGCLTCVKTRRCVLRDDAAGIVARMRDADSIAFATPIYYYGMCGQMKTLLDRSNPLYSDDYAFRDIYLLSAAAEAGEHTADGAVAGLEGWIACFGKARLAGTVFAGGVTAPGEIQGHPALERAYDMGRHV